MLFERKTYLDELISCEGNGMIKIITGVRRCGKSYLLFNLYKQNLIGRGVPEDHIIGVNLEDRRSKNLRDPETLLEYIDSKIPDKEKVDQEQASLLNIPDGFRKVIIDGDRYSRNYNDDGILIIGIYDFLLNGI